LQGNPDRDEIISDIEWAIGEKFRALLGSHKTVITVKEVAAVLAEMGPIEAADEASTTGAETSTGTASDAAGGSRAAKEEQPFGSGAAPKRLYRIHEGAMISGVCNGMATYLHVDPTFVRLGFVVLTIFWGTGLLVYVVMAFVVPEANSPEQKAAASGPSPTAQEFIRRAKEGYYEAVKGFPDRKARREWKRRFKREMRANTDQWRYNWHSYWADHAPIHPGIGFALPLLSLLHGLAKVLWICAIVSLLATGTVLGLALPAGVPVWVAVLVLFMLYGILTVPLKAARRMCYWGFGEPRRSWSFIFLADALVWFAVVFVLAWLAFQYFPEVRDAVHSIPGHAHQAINDVQAWVTNK
jgi:phage shock protein PspC (stress-responsive transcriptional regulator)